MVKIVLSDKAKLLLECVYSCNSVQELRDEYFPDYSLKDIEEAVEFCANLEEEYPEVRTFLAGIQYQKNKKKAKK